MKSLSHLLSFGAASALLFVLGCGNTATSISSASATNTTGGSGTIISGGDQTFIPILPTIPVIGAPVVPSAPAVNVYVVQNDPATGASSVLELPASAQGTVTPVATLLPPANTTFLLVVVDASGNIYVGAQTAGLNPNGEVLVYAPGATGAAAPVRTITGLQSMSDIAVDAAGQLYVLETDPTSGAGAINVFAADAAGTASPVRSISGNLTTLWRATSIAVDAADDVYVAIPERGSILVFPSTVNGNIAPSAVIGGPLYGIQTLSAVGVGPAGDVFATSTSYVTEFFNEGSFTPGNYGSTSVYTADGPDVGVAIDNAGNVYTVGTLNGAPDVNVYLGSLMDREQWQTMSSTAWTGSHFRQIAVH